MQIFSKKVQKNLRILYKYSYFAAQKFKTKNQIFKYKEWILSL